MNVFKHAAKAATLALLAGTASVQALTLPLGTTFVQANSVFTLTQEALDAVSATSTTMAALGTASDAAPVMSPSGDELPSFNLPITRVDVALGLPPFAPLLAPERGESMGAALSITRRSHTMVLANFVVDYSQDLILADITANGVTNKGASLYSFTPSDLNIGLNGLTLNMHQQLSKLVLTHTALATFASGLDLGRVLTAPLKTLDFGTITIDINGALREPVNATPFAAAAVPEAPTATMLGLGLCFLVIAVRRAHHRRSTA